MSSTIHAILAILSVLSAFDARACMPLDPPAERPVFEEGEWRVPASPDSSERLDQSRQEDYRSVLARSDSVFSFRLASWELNEDGDTVLVMKALRIWKGHVPPTLKGVADPPPSIKCGQRLEWVKDGIYVAFASPSTSPKDLFHFYAVQAVSDELLAILGEPRAEWIRGNLIEPARP